MSARASERLAPAEYAALVARLRATAAAALPAGASVLVLSKGDAALLELPEMSTSHFPQDAAGAYAGHHPPDSAAAVAHLLEHQASGAEYLVIPATASWWLDHYSDFAKHLATHAHILTDVPRTCRIYELSGRRAAETPATTEATTPNASTTQMRDYLENLIPADSSVAVLESTGVAAELAPLPLVALAPHELSPTDASPAEALARLAERGADYLVLPRAADEWLAQHAHVEEYIQSSCRKVADQRHLCRVFELKGLIEHV